jgi:transcriptional regulator with XRE-family HTH domain
MKLKKEQLAEVVKQRRNTKGYTQTELSELSKISLRSIQRIEKAEVLPRSYTINSLAKILDFKVEELTSEETVTVQQESSKMPKKVILSLGSGLILFLLALAFLAQANSFPENSFEAFNFWAAVVLVISTTQWFIWKN